MELIKNEVVEIKNPELKKATESIKTYATNIRKNYLRIADKLAEIDEAESYVEDGFGDVIEYAMTVFNMKKTTAYNLLKIGRVYIADGGDKTILADARGDYSVSQLGVLIPAGVERVMELNSDGVISPTMTVRKLASIIKEDIDEDDPETSNDEGDETENKPENEPTQTITLWINGDISFTGFDRLNEDDLHKLTDEITELLNKYL